jgi:hypothetical protein
MTVPFPKSALYCTGLPANPQATKFFGFLGWIGTKNWHQKLAPKTGTKNFRVGRNAGAKPEAANPVEGSILCFGFSAP